MQDADAATQTAVAALASTVRTLFGPHKARKCVIDGDGESFVVTGSEARLCEELVVEHPAVLLVLEAREGLHRAHGCGTTTLLCTSIFKTVRTNMASCIRHGG